MLHMTCQMQEMHKGKLYICYKGAPTHKAHRRPAPRGEVKRHRHHRKKSKEAQTHKLPLNTCTRAKEHTSSPLVHMIERRAQQTKWLYQGRTLEGHKFTYLYHFSRCHSSLSIIPKSDVPPCHHRGMRPENHPQYQPNVLRASHLQLKTKSESKQMTQH
jgi:hypothetical protein